MDMRMIQFTSRRAYIQQSLKPNTALLIRQPHALTRNHDVCYPFHPNRYFYYLSGFSEPNCWLLITPKNCTLWSEANNPKRSLWEGDVLAEQTTSVLNIDQWFDITSFQQTIEPLLNGLDTLYHIGEKPSLPVSLEDGTNLVRDLRIIKDPSEIDAIRQACNISAEAHNHLMRHAKNTPHETALEGLFLQSVMAQGVRSLAYPSIVASGKNACVLHYTDNNQPIDPNSLVLVDAGCEFEQYASDITRTFPANGQFSKHTQAVYEACLNTQEAVIQAVKPGMKLSELNQLASRLITEHLIKLNIITSSLDEALDKQIYKTYFPHGVGHTMGLDVHDIPLQDDTLQTGMVITIEPGIYIRESGPYQHIGVRIEDNILVTHDGNENLTQAAVKAPDAIISLMADD